MTGQPYRVIWTRTAQRNLNALPLKIVEVMHEHMTYTVAKNPHRLGKELEAPLDGQWSTRREDYRAIYEIDEDERSITVLAVKHRSDAYRTH